MPAKPRVTVLTVARLYNLGNYEHVRYEITVELPKGASANQTMFDLTGILDSLKPVPTPYNLENKKAFLTRLSSELSEGQQELQEQYRKEVAKYEHLKEQRKDALLGLDKIGGMSKQVDAKLTWERDWDNDDIPF